MKSIGKLMILLCIMSLPLSRTFAQISVGISVGIAPPALPVYVQPACPVDGYLWQPGYWAYDNTDGYYWVPGVWVAPPNPGLLWTPAYWGYSGGYYGFHAGYWGPHVGFYGGINYGFGYGGVGFAGGAWSGGSFRYNTAVVNVNTTVVHNTYIDRTVINNTTINNRASYNGPGGYTAKPRPEERAAMREQHVQPTAEQLSHQQFASKDKKQYVSYNNGQPAATTMNKINGRPINQQGHTAMASSLGSVHPRPNDNQPPNANHPAGEARPDNNKPETHAENRPQAQPARVQQPHNQQHPAQHAKPRNYPRPPVRPEHNR